MNFLVLPDVPRMPSVTSIKSQSCLIMWKAADDYLESRLERYIIQITNGGHMIRINITSGIEKKNFTYHLQNLTELTFYDLRIAAKSSIGKSNFTRKLVFLTLCKYISTECPKKMPTLNF